MLRVIHFFVMFSQIFILLLLFLLHLLLYVFLILFLLLLLHCTATAAVRSDGKMFKDFGYVHMHICDEHGVIVFSFFHSMSALNLLK